MSVGVKTPTRSQFEHAEFLCGEIVSSPKEIPPSTSSGLDSLGATKSRVEGSNCAAVNRSYLNVEGAQRYQTSSSWSRNDRQHDSSFRKRRYSQPQKSLENSAFGSLRRRRLASQIDSKLAEKCGNIILPTKFLLGGNINDPLNLNGLYEDDVGRILNERTPESSPLPTPSHRGSVEVKIPPNITDPLNLNSDDADNKGVKKRKRSNYNRHKRKEGIPQILHSTPIFLKDASDNGKDVFNPLKIEIDASNEICDDTDEDLSLDIQCANLNKMSAPNKIVSPVIPQASPKFNRRRRMTISECRADVSTDTARVLFRSSSSPDPHKISPFRKYKKQVISPKTDLTKTKFSSNPKFIHGNYNRYYGYRNPGHERDHRMDSFDSEWFECKDVLDIGCNVGNLTLAIARDFLPQKIVGMDIDSGLIKAARKNIRQYLSTCANDTSKYPVSCSTNYGPISAPSVGETKSASTFPNNLMFIQGDVVLEDDGLLQYQLEEYDMILALSITKWIHLNHGDAGLKRVFKRIYKQLRPGGKLILEPQPWSSYKKRKKLTEKIYDNYKSIELKPDAFSNFLLTEVGFNKCEVIGVPFNKSKGFRRPLQLYTKTDTIGNTPNIPYPEENTDSQKPETKPSQSRPDSIGNTPIIDTEEKTDDKKIENGSRPDTIGNTPIIDTEEKTDDKKIENGSRPDTIGNPIIDTEEKIDDKKIENGSRPDTIGNPIIDTEEKIDDKKIENESRPDTIGKTPIIDTEEKIDDKKIENESCRSHPDTIGIIPIIDAEKNTCGENPQRKWCKMNVDDISDSFISYVDGEKTKTESMQTDTRMKTVCTNPCITAVCDNPCITSVCDNPCITAVCDNPCITAVCDNPCITTVCDTSGIVKIDAAKLDTTQNTVGDSPSMQGHSVTEISNTVSDAPSVRGNSVTEMSNTVSDAPSVRGNSVTEMSKH